MNRAITILLIVLAVEGAYVASQARCIAQGIEEVRAYLGIEQRDARGPNPWRSPLYDESGTLLKEGELSDPMAADYVTTQWMACAVRESMIAESRRGAALRAQLDQVIELLEERPGGG